MGQHELHVTVNGADRTVACDPDTPLLDGDTLDAVQQAFIDEQAAQCGYCTSGMVVSAVALLRSNHSPTEREVREALDRNLCRCGAHRRIVGAVMKAASEVAEQAR